MRSHAYVLRIRSGSRPIVFTLLLMCSPLELEVPAKYDMDMGTGYWLLVTVLPILFYGTVWYAEAGVVLVGDGVGGGGGVGVIVIPGVCVLF